MTEARPTFRDQLAALEAAGARRRDPVRFRYLESLTGRLADSRHPAHHEKLQRALDEFRKKIEKTPSTPEPGPVSSSPLRVLVAQLQSSEDGSDEADSDDPLAALFKQQKAKLKSSEDTAAPPRRELKAARHLRASQARLHTETRIARAIADTPGDAGPLNAHRLVTRALERIREISPAYLNRFAGYTEVLMLLEKNNRRG